MSPDEAQGRAIVNDWLTTLLPGYQLGKPGKHSLIQPFISI